MTTFEISLRLDDDLDVEAASIAFYDMLDGTIGRVGGRSIATVVQSARSGIEAAEEAVSTLGFIDITVVDLDMDLVNCSDIADRIGRTRQSVRQMVTGDRGPGGFPSPLGTPGGQRVWAWGTVAEWLAGHGVYAADPRPLTAVDVDEARHWLRAQRDAAVVMNFTSRADPMWQSRSRGHAGLAGGDFVVEDLRRVLV